MKPSGITRRLLAAAICGLLLCAACLPASAETAVVNNPDPTDRLNLRESPKSGATILYKYFSGVEVQILSTPSKDWAKVRIGSLEGYMQRQYLATGSAASSVPRAFPSGQVDVTYPQTRLALREQPSDDAQAVGSYDQGTMVDVLGVSDGWLHVRIPSDGRMGFMRSAWVTGAENLKYASVNAEKATLRQAPKPDGKSLGVYGRGVPMVLLFSFEKLSGFSRVRIGDTVGFMASDALLFSPEPGASAFSYESRVVKNPGSFVHLRKTASTDALSLAKLDDGVRVSVLGAAGDWTHVQADGLYGYVQTRFLQ